MRDHPETALSHETLVHDLNSVFETITDAAELLSSDRKWKPLAATIVRSVARGRRLLGAIPDNKPFLSTIVDAAAQSITDYCSAARKPRMTIFREGPQNFHLPGSAKEWERVFANLFLNTAQIMRKPGRIVVSAAEVEGRLTITVADNGPGIRADLLPRLFEPEVSSKEEGAAAKRTGARSGLGLHIVSTIVEAYGGTVGAANAGRQGGAIFSIHLPRGSNNQVG